MSRKFKLQLFPSQKFKSFEVQYFSEQRRAKSIREEAVSSLPRSEVWRTELLRDLRGLAKELALTGDRCTNYLKIDDDCEQISPV
uniref:Uncharacterized protein n=1 Tax=Romanomermis culicivorax TaxID=13658 RepID=A0A915IQ33_ROMCU